MAVKEPSKPIFIPVLPRSFWERDPEVASFVRTLFGKVRIVDMPARVSEVFPKRAPSKSAIMRYMNSLRGFPPEVSSGSRRRAKSRLKSLKPAK